jgi:hypothetical protein
MVGIDKIGITSKDYRIRNLDRLSHAPPHIKGIKEGEVRIEPTPFASDGRGEPMIGKYYSNDHLISLDIDFRGMKISFNPSRMISEDLHYLSRSRGEVTKCGELIKSKLLSLGIDCSIEDHNLSRVDLAQDSHLPDQVKSYIEVMRMLRGKRMKSKEYPDGFLFSNTLRQFCFYDRGEKIRLDGGEELSNNLGRGELRMTKKISVEKTLGISTFRQMVDTEPDQLECIYHNFVSDDIFKSRLDPTEMNGINIESEISLFTDCYATMKRGGVNRYLEDFGIDQVINLHGSFDNFFDFLIQCGVAQSTAYRQVNQMRLKFQRKGFVENRRKTRTTSDRIHELQNIFGLAI